MDRSNSEQSTKETAPKQDSNNRAQTYRSRTRVSKNLLASRLGTFILAILGAVVVFVGKRYDIDDLFGTGIVQLWTGEVSSRPQDSYGTPTREYAVCTRHKDGIYTVGEGEYASENGPTTQCLVVGTDGTITGTGSIGTAINNTFHPQAHLYRLNQGNAPVRSPKVPTKTLDCCARTC